jgi:hypothetical protein
MHVNSSKRLQENGKGGFMMLQNLKALLPEIKAANEVYDAEYRAALNGTAIECEPRIQAAAATFNAVLMKAVEAIHLDTKHTNSRETILQAFGQVNHNHYYTLFGHIPYKALAEAVENDSIKKL